MVLWAQTVTVNLTQALRFSGPQLSFLGAVTPPWLWPLHLSINQDALKDTKFHYKTLNMQA